MKISQLKIEDYSEFRVVIGATCPLDFRDS